ncbi:unnamed protein product, partial [Ectocarpus sp. 4 AP-2014]
SCPAPRGPAQRPPYSERMREQKECVSKHHMAGGGHNKTAAYDSPFACSPKTYMIAVCAKHVRTCRRAQQGGRARLPAASCRHRSALVPHGRGLDIRSFARRSQGPRRRGVSGVAAEVPHRQAASAGLQRGYAAGSAHSLPDVARTGPRGVQTLHPLLHLRGLQRPRRGPTPPPPCPRPSPLPRVPVLRGGDYSREAPCRRRGGPRELVRVLRGVGGARGEGRGGGGWGRGRGRRGELRGRGRGRGSEAGGLQHVPHP